MYRNIKEIKERINEHRNELYRLKHDYFFVALQGSWNYGLGYEKSDVDTKALVLPDFRQIVLNKRPISTTHLMENNEHLDLKDIRVMFENFWKQNINFLEILFTEYVVINPAYLDQYFALVDMREDIAHYDETRAVNCMCGMALEKLHALKKPYPATEEDIKKYGYSPKEFHHIIRMYNFLRNYIAGMEFEKCLTAHDPYPHEMLMKAKRGELSLDFAEKTSAELVAEMKEMKDKYLDSHTWGIDIGTRRAAEEVIYDVLRKKFVCDFNI